MNARDERWACRSLAGFLVGSLMGCGSGTPPERVPVPKVSKEVSSEPKGATSRSRPDVPVPAGSVYGFDPTCDKCKRTRGEGCVFKVQDSKPVGCGSVGAAGKHAVVAWATRKAKHTWWWFGREGKTKAFWTPCSIDGADDDCKASVHFLGDGSWALVTYGVEGSHRNSLYDVDAGTPTEVPVEGAPVVVPSPDGMRTILHESSVGASGHGRPVCLSVSRKAVDNVTLTAPWTDKVRAGDALVAKWTSPTRVELSATREGTEVVRVPIDCP